MDAGKESENERKYGYSDTKEKEGLCGRPDIYDIKRMFPDRTLCSDSVSHMVCVQCILYFQLLSGVSSGLSAVAP